MKIVWHGSREMNKSCYYYVQFFSFSVHFLSAHSRVDLLPINETWIFKDLLMFIPISFLTISSTEESFVVFFLFIFYHRPSSFYPPSSHFIFLSDPHSLAISICLSIHSFFFYTKQSCNWTVTVAVMKLRKFKISPEKKIKHQSIFSFSLSLFFFWRKADILFCLVWTLDIAFFLTDFVYFVTAGKTEKKMQFK